MKKRFKIYKKNIKFKKISKQAYISLRRFKCKSSSLSESYEEKYLEYAKKEKEKSETP